MIQLEAFDESAEPPRERVESSAEHDDLAAARRDCLACVRLDQLLAHEPVHEDAGQKRTFHGENDLAHPAAAEREFK